MCCMPRTDSPRDLPPELAHLREHPDALVQECLEVASSTVGSIRGAPFWLELSAALGSTGDANNALKACEDGLRITGHDPRLLVNKGGLLGQIGRHDEAISTLEAVPVGNNRRSIILANVLQDMDRHEEALPHYEEAIQEEPDFFLPYARIVKSVQALRRHDYEFWLRMGIRNVPKSTTLARLWCYHLLTEGRLDELANAAWIDKLESDAGRHDMSDRSTNSPLELLEAQIFREIALVGRDSSKTRLQGCLSKLRQLPPSRKWCEIAKLIAASCANLGDPEGAAFSHAAICSTCRTEQIGTVASVSTLLARAHLRAGGLEVALKHSSDAYREQPECQTTLWDHWWILDDLGRVDEAILVAEKLLVLTPTHDHLNYNLGLMCSKIGRLGKSRHYYDAATNINISFWMAHENLAFIELLSQDAAAAEQSFAAYESEFRKAHSEAAADDGDGWQLTADGMLDASQHLRAKRAKFERLKTEANEVNGLDDHALRLTKSNEADTPFIGSDVILGTCSWSFAELVGMLKAEGPERADAMFVFDMEARGDRSHIFAHLQAEFPGWPTFPPEAQAALVESETRFREEKGRDCSLEAVGFAKAVEICLAQLVFAPLCLQMAGRSDQDALLSQIEPERKLGAFFRYLNGRGNLGLGDMVRLLAMTGGKTTRRVQALTLLRQHAAHAGLGPEHLAQPELDAIDRLAQEFRNPGAHRAIISRPEAVEARQIALSTLKKLHIPGQTQLY